MKLPMIILAAGESRRLGQPKQLVLYEGETLLERALRIARESGAGPVLAVLGAHLEMISAQVRREDVILVHNDEWGEGIATSIRAGLLALDTVAPESDGALIMTCDQPRLTASHLRALADVFKSHAGGTIVASTYSGIVGVPAVFPRATFSQLLALRGDQGARKLLVAPPCEVIVVNLFGGEVDVDSPEDLMRLKRGD